MTEVAYGVGIKIRTLRKQKGMALNGLAHLCKCSSSLLSQIERGLVNPSFSTLKSIGDALETSMAQLVTEVSTDKDSSSSLMRPKERKVLTTKGGVQHELLSQNVNVSFEFILNQWPPGSSTGKQLYTHEGEECGLLLEGELEVEVNGKVHHMKAGDTITIRSSVPHRTSNPGNKKAVALWVNSIPWVFSIK
jgi:transcriptional regulator with XRE-family HTH domain